MLACHPTSHLLIRAYQTKPSFLRISSWEFFFASQVTVLRGSSHKWNNHCNFQGPPIMGPAYGKRDPYYSHIFRDSYGNGMGIVWVPLTTSRSHVLGGPWNHPWNNGSNKLHQPGRPTPWCPMSPQGGGPMVLAGNLRDFWRRWLLDGCHQNLVTVTNGNIPSPKLTVRTWK